MRLLLEKAAGVALVLAPHTDDGEFGCGGTIAKLLRNGTEVHYVAFSAAEDSVPAGLPKDVLRKEVMLATGELGLPADKVTIHSYPVRKFPQYRQEILEDLIQIKRLINPSIVFCPSPTDVHQDHQVMTAEATRAFKDRTVLGYEMPWNNISINTSCFVLLEEQDVNRKISALACYISQSYRSYIDPEFIRSLTRVRGAQIGVRYAEVFQVIRFVLD